MRNISFMLTPGQILDGSKTVTRRLGWLHLRPGDLLQGVEKGMGLRKGEKVQRLRTIRVVDVRPEALSAMTADPEYGRAECVREGFGNHPELREPAAFVTFFCRTHRGCRPETTVTRIAFEYVDGHANEADQS
ncbi:ASCH domain-containing protein [Burkholderia vietnamiensis]|uniref:hypothetical protein n=1 Tax=Burkholderia vietnamiensis TaxID=60552 RepID=UPI001D13819C|nr:hypothetical protein [Burkholderia vietnamiensis]UEC05470.1 hypothetical protein LK462_35270 [Burkholderia vietnamiensis]